MEKEVYMGHLLHQVVRTFFSRGFTMLESLNVHPGQVFMLHYLNKKDGVSQKELAEKLLVKPSTITVMINRMEAAGYIGREIDTEDRRITRVIMTEKGREVSVKVEEAMKVLENEALQDITEEEQKELKRLLWKIKGNLKKEDLEDEEVDYYKMDMRSKRKC
ncbi:MAG: MarR family transcriptional regulator [Clostridiales bacterium]|nr:MarR family transcriptional regulator [Clostridiales bacterium]